MEKLFSFEVQTYSTPLVETMRDIESIQAIFNDSFKYFNLAIDDTLEYDIRNGLMIASIVLFFSCFEKHNYRYSLQESMYRKDHLIYEQYEQLKEVRNKRIAHRAQRKGRVRAMRPTDPSMASTMPLAIHRDASAVPFNITEEEVRKLYSLLRFTAPIIEKELQKCNTDMAKENLGRTSSTPAQPSHKSKSKNKKKSRKERKRINQSR